MYLLRELRLWLCDNATEVPPQEAERGPATYSKSLPALSWVTLRMGSDEG